MNLGQHPTGVRRSMPSIGPSRLDVGIDQALCRRWRDRHDISAAGELAARHLSLVVAQAERHRGSGLAWEDLAAEGHIGLMRAICRFDPDGGVGFGTYAAWWVAVSLQDYVLRHRVRPNHAELKRWG